LIVLIKFDQFEQKLRIKFKNFSILLTNINTS
jgi:hypothetical protein